MQRIETALLPIDTPVLPGGRRELRLVTPGQKRMLAASFRDNASLAVCMNRQGSNMPCYPIATLVNVVDFHQLEDDSLSILVEGQQKVRIIETWGEGDGVWMGQALPMTNWASRPMNDSFTMVADALKQLYEAQPQLAELYKKPLMDDACWVSQRWLEVLPLVEQEKQALMSQPDCGKTMHYVMSLISEHH